MENSRVGRTRALSGPLVCSIGSTDPTAAAGIGRDLVVYERLGARGAFAVAAVTAQQRRGVTRVTSISPSTLKAQLAAIWSEEPPDAIRIGLLPGAALIAGVARFLRSLPSRPPTVLDPIVSASSGRRFLGLKEIRALQSLLPLVTLVTPNAGEAELLTGVRVRSVADARRAALALHARGCAALVKGGHIDSKLVVDVLADYRGVVLFAAPRILSSMRGTGCTLAAAIAVSLARKEPLREAIARARAFVRRELKSQLPGLKRPGPRTRAKGRA